MTKNGKKININLSPRYNISYGTVNNKNIKSIYINIKAWGEPTKEDVINYNRIIHNLSKKIKQTIYNHIKSNNRDRFIPNMTIVDLDMRESGIKYGTKSFMNCEITIFQNRHYGPLNDIKTTKIMKNLINTTIKSLDEYKYFNFYKTK